MRFSTTIGFMKKKKKTWNNSAFSFHLKMLEDALILQNIKAK